MRTLLRKTVDGLAQHRRESGCELSIGFMTGIRTFLENYFCAANAFESSLIFPLNNIIHQ
jgi:hypothetical protein